MNQSNIFNHEKKKLLKIKNEPSKNLAMRLEY